MRHTFAFQAHILCFRILYFICLFLLTLRRLPPLPAILEDVSCCSHFVATLAQINFMIGTYRNNNQLIRKCATFGKMFLLRQAVLLGNFQEANVFFNFLAQMT